MTRYSRKSRSGLTNSCESATTIVEEVAGRPGVGEGEGETVVVVVTEPDASDDATSRVAVVDLSSPLRMGTSTSSCCDSSSKTESAAVAANRLDGVAVLVAVLVVATVVAVDRGVFDANRGGSQGGDHDVAPPATHPKTTGQHHNGASSLAALAGGCDTNNGRPFAMIQERTSLGREL